MKLKMGTRGSALALAQSGWAARELERLNPGLRVETVVIKTSGDLFGTVPPKEAQALTGSTKGLFVKEIEEALSAGSVDFAVHSAKDMPAQLMPGLAVAAYPVREDPRDVFIGRDGLRWADIPAGARVATSSLRRKYQLLRHAPKTEVVPLRGNVDTRIRKLASGACDGLVLAAAGLRRLGRSDVKAEVIDFEHMLPAPGQGALALEVKDGSAAEGLVRRLDDAATRRAVELERAFLAAVGGGCSTPLAALARPSGSGLDLSVFWAREDGSGAVRLSEVCRDLSRMSEFATALAARLKPRP